MKKLWMGASLAALFCSCGAPAEKTEEPLKYSDWTSQNLKGMVKSLETTSYTPDSTGAIGAPDSCCIELELYDEKGFTTSFSSKTKDGVPSEEMTMTRYEGGQWKEMVNKKNGKVQGTFSIEIDANGKYFSAKDYDSSGTLRGFYTDLTEDEDGSVTGGIMHNPDSSIKSSFEAKYKKGLQISNIAKDSTGKVTFESNSELNEKGDIVKTTIKEVGKDSTTTKVETFTYDTYDDKGNWTQRTTYDEKGKATKVRKRVITYFTKE
jgi:lysyl-tRNA synthetase class II